jgi:hypothetical protein
MKVDEHARLVTRERENTRIYISVHKGGENTKDRDRRCDIIRDDITRTKTRYIDKTKERDRGFDTANKWCLYNRLRTNSVLMINFYPYMSSKAKDMENQFDLHSLLKKKEFVIFLLSLSSSSSLSSPALIIFDTHLNMKTLFNN